MTSIQKHAGIGLLYAFLSFFMFALSDAACKALSQTYTTFDIRFWTCIITFFFFLGFGVYRKRVRALLYTKHPYLHLIRCACMAPIMLMVPFVLETMPLVNFYTIIFTTPMMTCLVAYLFFKDKITPNIIMTIILGFLGVVIAFRPGIETLNLPFLLCLLIVFLTAVMANMYRLFPITETKTSFVLYPTIVSFVVSLFFVTPKVLSPSLFDFALLMVMSLAIIFGVIFSIIAYEKTSVANVSVTHYSQLLWGLIFGYVIFGDLPDYYVTIGATIVTLSGILLAFSTRRRKKTRKLNLKNFFVRLQRQ